MNISEKKNQLRQRIRLERNSFDSQLKQIADHSICEQLIHIIQANSIQVVHTYIPMGSEVNVLPVIRYLLEIGATVVCPKTLPNRQLEHRVLVSLNELEEGPMKTQHPKAANIYAGLYDLIIVPGLAFDSDNFRLGYGGGYYDTFLSLHPEAESVGVFYHFQKVQMVPRETHDRSLNQIVC